MVEINTLWLARRYVKYVIFEEKEALARIEKRYPVVTAIVATYFDLESLRNRRCSVCGKEFKTRSGLYKHLTRSSSCKIEFWLNLYAIEKSMGFVKKLYNKNRLCYEVNGRCVKASELADMIMKGVKPWKT